MVAFGFLIGLPGMEPVWQAHRGQFSFNMWTFSYDFFNKWEREVTFQIKS